MTTCPVRVRFWAAMSLWPAALASCGGPAAPRDGGAEGAVPEPTAPPTPSPIASDPAAPPASAVAAAPTADPPVAPAAPAQMTQEEWALAIREVLPACGVDAFRELSCIHKGELSPRAPGATGPDTSVCPASISSTQLSSRVPGRAVAATLDPLYTNGSAVCCYSWCQPLRVLPAAPAQCAAPLVRQSGGCIDAPERGTSVPAPAPLDLCPRAMVVAAPHAYARGTFAASLAPARSRPATDGTVAACCYETCAPRGPQPRKGRPLRIDGEIRLAPAVDRDDWRRPDAEGDAEARGPWLHDALLEHASIASFAHLSLALLAFGAPPDLIADAHRAAIDEIEHARTCFALASRPSRALGPGPDPAFAAIAVPQSLVELALETFEDGCVGETMASLALREEASRVSSPTLREELHRMAEDEARHAELAWRIVAWATRTGGTEVAEAVARAAASSRAGAPDDPRWRWVHDVVIDPCASEVLAGAARGRRIVAALPS